MALGFFHVEGAADEQFSQAGVCPLKAQSDLFDLRGCSVAIEVAAEGRQFRHGAFGLGHFQVRIALDRAGLQVGAEGKGEITAEPGLQQPVGVLHAGVGAQRQLSGLAVFEIIQGHVDMGEFGDIAIAVLVKLHFADGGVGEREFFQIKLRRL